MSGYMKAYIFNKERRGKNVSEKISRIRNENQKTVFYQSHSKYQTTLNQPVHTNECTKFNKKYTERELTTSSIQQALQVENTSDTQRIIKQNKKAEDHEKSKLVLSADDFFQNKADPKSKNNLKLIINTNKNFNKQFVFQQNTTEKLFTNKNIFSDKESISTHSIDTDNNDFDDIICNYGDHDDINDYCEEHHNDCDDIIHNYGDYDDIYDESKGYNTENNNNEENGKKYIIENNTNENIIYHETNNKKKAKSTNKKSNKKEHENIMVMLLSTLITMITIIIILLSTTLITTQRTSPYIESNISLQAYHSLEHVFTTYVLNPLEQVFTLYEHIIIPPFTFSLQAHTSLEQVFGLYEYIIIPPFPFNHYIGTKQFQASYYNSRKKNALQRHVEDEEHINIIFSKNTSNLIIAWHSRLDVWSNHYQYPHLKLKLKDGHCFRHDDGKDQAHLAWLSSNKIRKKTQHLNAS
jgi:hypothetical protein